MAQKDATALGGMDDVVVFADEVFGFHAQQAVEKALKAWLTLKGIEYPKTHDLASLLHLLQGSGADVSVFVEMIELSVFSVQYRYEAFDLDEEPLNRVAIRARIQELFRVVDTAITAAEQTPRP
jgi:HEPN domain-containing protein